MRKINFSLLSLLFLCLTTFATNAEPTPPQGFTLTELKEIQTKVFKPDGWHVLHLPRKSPKEPEGYQITKEDNAKLGGFKTGLTINVFEKVPEHYQAKPSALASTMMARYAGNGEVQSFKDGLKAGNLQITRMKLKRTMLLLGEETETMVIFTTMADDETGVCYLFIFGTPVSEWETNEKILTTMSQVDLMNE